MAVSHHICGRGMGGEVYPRPQEYRFAWEVRGYFVEDLFSDVFPEIRAFNTSDGIKAGSARL